MLEWRERVVQLKRTLRREPTLIELLALARIHTYDR